MASGIDETHGLIGSDKVEGTAVYDADGQKIGSIERLMIDKLSGRGVLCGASVSEAFWDRRRSYPLPWASLKYKHRALAATRY